ncbi:hypothetical protein DPMN_167122 [Dreissena polymorpha]|uniref:Uncharacterized protein n=1 Tax=Dreissena polymorpha TaxID=45954 RepID=A0A9D4F056_DREPO|nr:hypothetical protein DPMN_167122 [Dreissena polymorpha]
MRNPPKRPDCGVPVGAGSQHRSERERSLGCPARFKERRRRVAAARRCLRNNRSRLEPVLVSLERKSSLALHGVEALAVGYLTATASRPVNVQTKTTILGSCVDEERNQLRELM